MTAETLIGDFRELAYREADGIEVTLYWRERNGNNETAIAYRDLRTGEFWAANVRPTLAYHAFTHPNAYR